jgi:hypothetical protein
LHQGIVKPTDAEPPAKCCKIAEVAANLVVLLATGVFWIFMTWICYGHTPDAPENWKWGLAAYTAACISGIFWLAAQGFRVALMDYRRIKKAGGPQ